MTPWPVRIERRLVPVLMRLLDEIIDRRCQQLRDFDSAGLGVPCQGRMVLFADTLSNQLGRRSVLLMPPVAPPAVRGVTGIQICHQTPDQLGPASSGAEQLLHDSDNTIAVTYSL